jgi:hypothetical protein
MSKKTPKRDPIRARQRAAAAARRMATRAKCHICGESRPLALIRGSNPLICAECQRKEQAKSPMDRHHVAGKNNHPGTVEIPANDHRAQLSQDQYDWPKQTLENPDGSPLRRAAAFVRGAIDMIFHIVDKYLPVVADLLEKLDDYLMEKWGRKYWVGTPLAAFAPKGGPNG